MDIDKCHKYIEFLNAECDKYFKDQVIEEYKAELGKMTKGIGCIRFKKLDEINLDTLKKILKLAEKNLGLANARMVYD